MVEQMRMARKKLRSISGKKWKEKSSVQPPSPSQAGLLEEWMVERAGEVEEVEGELTRPKPEKGLK